MAMKVVQALLCFFIVVFVCQSNYDSKVQADYPGDVHKVRLSWPAVPDAVMYELVIRRQPDGAAPAASETVLKRTDIYTAGVELDVPALEVPIDSLWWQVRALSFDQLPISEFSPSQRVVEGEINPVSPLPTARLDQFPYAKLYPAYAWIPVLNAASYEVQILAANPDQTNKAAVIRSYQIDGALAFDYYDERAYTEEGVYWWRVRARDSFNQPIGRWSPASSFQVLKSDTIYALFGDSVAHGGGAISNPPSDPAYDLTSYAGIPIRNLGRSGDTVARMIERFESDVLTFSPRILVIMGGINDIRAGRPAAAVIAELAVIRELCRKNAIIPVFVTLTPVNPAAIKRVFGEDTSPQWRDEWLEVNRWIKQQPYHVDISPFFAGPDGVLPSELAVDGLHPDTKGKAMMGKAVGSYLQRHFL